MLILIPTKNPSERVQGNQIPVVINGRPRSLYVNAMSPTKTPQVIDLKPAMKETGAQLGSGVPFAAMYMTRTNKKHAVLRSAA